MHSIRTLLLACATSAAALPALADDSSATLGAGGLTLMQSADIRMAAEDLRISPKAVSVRFEFANGGSKDIDTVVAFVLPDIDTYKFWGEAIGSVAHDPVNFMDFDAVADGKRVPVNVEQHAMFNGRDVTAVVKSAGAPVNPVLAGWDTLKKLPKEKMHILDAAGLVEHDGDDPISKWMVRTRFYWRQHFPAGKAVVLEQHYQPVTGQSFFSELELNGSNKEDGDYYRKNFCLDGPTRSTIARKIAEAKKADPQNGGMLNAFSTDYVLTTGNNWKGPIGHFRLTVDKLRTDNIVSMCWNGDLKKTGATTFEAARENYAPERDIQLLVLTSAPPPG